MNATIYQTDEREMDYQMNLRPSKKATNAPKARASEFRATSGQPTAVQRDSPTPTKEDPLVIVDVIDVQ